MAALNGSIGSSASKWRAYDSWGARAASVCKTLAYKTPVLEGTAVYGIRYV